MISRIFFPTFIALFIASTAYANMSDEECVKTHARFHTMPIEELTTLYELSQLTKKPKDKKLRKQWKEVRNHINNPLHYFIKAEYEGRKKLAEAMDRFRNPIIEKEVFSDGFDESVKYSSTLASLTPPRMSNTSQYYCPLEWNNYGPNRGWKVGLGAYLPSAYPPSGFFRMTCDRSAGSCGKPQFYYVDAYEGDDPNLYYRSMERAVSRSLGETAITLIDVEQGPNGFGGSNYHIHFAINFTVDQLKQLTEKNADEAIKIYNSQLSNGGFVIEIPKYLIQAFYEAIREEAETS